MVLEKSLQMNFNQVEAWTNLGFAYMTKRNVIKAQSCYDKALSLDPDFGQALLNYEALHQYTGNKKEAAHMQKRLQQLEKRYKQAMPN
jgi:cytochrome c-type biogenesis protein CcmH/NrfG